MKGIFAKTIRIGRLSVSFFQDEIVFIYFGSTVYMKSFRRNFSVIGKKTALAMSATFVFIVALTSYLLSFTDLDSVNEDDEIKNRLLQSQQTDYSLPVISEKLQVAEHRVKKTETLGRIAKQYGVSIDTICGSNNLRTYDFVGVGTVLKIPNKDGIMYKMAKGENLVNIAVRYRVSLKKILDENNIKNPDFVPLNMKLFIPDAKPQNIIIGFIWPTGARQITCGYGWRRNPFNYRIKEFHQGLDIRSIYNWIKASKYGQVTFTGWLGGYGNAIIVAHPGGWKTLYGHLSKIIVRSGQYVKQGQSIAKSGNTGRSTGPHLHFEIIKNGQHKNPYYYIKKNFAAR